MNAYIGNILQNGAQLRDNFDYNKPKRASERKSMFQIFSPKKKNSRNLFSDILKDIFNANNNINSILSKNLKSIYNENKDIVGKNNCLYDNVNSLIRKNRNSNKFYYHQALNIQNNSKNNKETNESNNLFFPNKKKFQNTAIINSKNLLKKEDITRNSIKKTIDIGKKIDLFSLNKQPNKKENKKNKNGLNFNLDKFECKTPNNRIPRKKFGFFPNNKRKSSLLNNFNFNLKKPKIKYECETPKQKNNMFNKLLFKDKDNALKDNKEKIMLKSNKEAKNKESNKINRRRFSANIITTSTISSLQSNSIMTGSRHSSFIESPKHNMMIPTLKEINCTIKNSYIAKNMGKIKKELDDFENNEISEIINNLPQDQQDTKKVNNFSNFAKINAKQKINKEQKKESKNNELLAAQIENLNAMEDDRFQKKYRKLYLSKNLYDSLDDEEVVDMEKIYTFYISPNSLTVYILDFFVLIGSIIELFNVPIYISVHLPSFAVYNSIIGSLIFYIIDFIYIIDLISGFFRAYYNFEEVLIKRNVNICIHYLTGWFFLDLIEAIPIFTLLNHNMKKSMKSFDRTSNMYDFGLNNKYFALTLIKMFKIFKAFNYNRFSNYIYKILDKINFFYEWKGLFFSIFFTCSTLHFCTCFFVFLGKNEAQGWIVKNNLQDSRYINIYIASLYYQMTTFTTVGYGDISSTSYYEHIYGIFILIVGTCVYSWILAYISNYIKKNNEKYVDFENKMNVLNDIKLEYPNLKHDLYERIIRYLNYNKSEHKYNLKFILESLPSSLQNNLIIEIYKPIIMNFQFFKSFENSNFFVKIVTSLKPILSMKDDILIQEGDIIEDIIFIKKGVLTLEIIIDLNDPKKSIESHLEMTGIESLQTISYEKFNTLMNFNTSNTNYKPQFGKQICNNKYMKKKELKIIDLRKNEHFGDILMILNEKSPVAVKVKSRKAELFFLQKTEATEISNRYSNIWKRIVNRSLHNMKQIKNLIRKKIFLFIETNNVEVNKEIIEKYLMNVKNIYSPIIKNKIREKKSVKSIETILEEEDESLLYNNQTTTFGKSSELTTKEQTQKIQSSQIVQRKSTEEEQPKIKKKRIKKVNFRENEVTNDSDNYFESKSFDKNILQNSEKNEIISIMKKQKKSDSFIESKKNIEINNNIQGVNSVINIVDKEIKNSNHINNYNINIYTPKLQFPLGKLNFENNNSSRININEKEEKNNSYLIGKVNSEISLNNDLQMDIMNNNIWLNNLDENSNILYSNIKDTEKEDKKHNKNSNVADEYILNIEKLVGKDRSNKIMNKKQIEKAEIKTDDKISIKSKSSDKSRINMKNEDITQTNKINKFSNLNTSQSTSFSINSSYDNINQISKFNFEKNSDLREKTKNFILEQIDIEKKPNIVKTKTTKTNNNFLNIQNNINLNSKKPIVRKKSENIVKSNILNKTEYVEHMKRSTIQYLNKEFVNGSKSSKKFEIDDEDFQKRKESRKSLSVININGNRNSIKKKPIKKYISVGTKDITFYNKINKMKTLKKRRANSIEDKNEKEKENKNIKVNYDKLIMKNIEKNKQNLNNPEEYFEGFFNDIIFNQNKGNQLWIKNEVKKSSTLDN